MGTADRRKREKDRRKKTIIRSAKRLFLKKGFKTVTVAAIAKQAKISKGAVYLHFDSKEEIYLHVLINDIDKFYDSVSTIFDPDKSALEILTDFVSFYIDFFMNERELFRILMNFMLHTTDLNFPETVNGNIIKKTNRAISIIEQIFQYGVDRGEFDPREDMRKVRNALWGMLNGVIALHLFMGKESSREERIRSNVMGGLKIIMEGLKNPAQGGSHG